MTSLGRPFSTKQTGRLQTYTVTSGLGVARQTDEHQQAACAVQSIDGTRTTQAVTANKAKVQLEESGAAHMVSGPPTDDYDAALIDQKNAGSVSESGESFEISEDDVMDNGTDMDYIPETTDESEDAIEEDSSQSDKLTEETTETHTPLDFQIPGDVLRAAMAAPENSRASFWSSNLYRGPEDRKILVHYCKTKKVAERVAQHFVGEKVLGFDIEWKQWSHPLSIKQNVSLVQLACEDRIALFHIAMFSETTAAQIMPPTLKTIIESPDIIKVGVAIKGDFSRVSKHLGVEPQGIFELSRLNNLVQHHATDPSKVSKKLVSLTNQVEQHLQLPLYKGGQLIEDPEDTYNVRSSDWSLPLNNQQIHYAAADAYAGFRLYDALEEKRKQLKPTPPRPLVCDYDAKPKPKSSDSKPRKKRAKAVKAEEAAVAVAEESSALAEQEEDEVEDEQVGDTEEKSSQDTDSYETAQEDFLDSHQLEGEEPLSSEESYESTDESDDSDDSASIGSVPSPIQEKPAAAAVIGQRRVGRINLNRLKGPDPGYPTLPKLHGDDDIDTSSDEEALVDISERCEEARLHTNDESIESESIITLEEDPETDEFDDSELEEALQDLSIGSDGELHGVSIPASSDESAPSPTQSELSAESSSDESDAEASFEQDLHDDKPTEPAAPSTSHDPAFDTEEQQLLDLLHDPALTEYLHSPSSSPPTSPPLSSAPAEPEQQSELPSSHALATSWAQSYLATSIPSPSSLTPSHIRATIPHLRAYHMWAHQKLPLDTIATLLRDPPLPASTVGSYVLQAITLERMEYDEEEVRAVLMGMPQALRRGKWRVLAEKVGAR